MLCLISLDVSTLVPGVSAAQIARVEVHAIRSVTMTDQDFLNGRKDGTPAILAGQRSS